MTWIRHGTEQIAFKNFSGRKGYASMIVKGEWKAVKSRPVDEKVGNQITFASTRPPASTSSSFFSD